MKNLQKIEIITEKRAVKDVINILDRFGIIGYTVINDVIGKGKRGIKHGEDLNDIFNNCMIISVCEEEQILQIVPELKVFLKKISGICIISDVKYLVN